MKQNIVLIGMPSSGKSTIGRMLAKRLSRQLVETDARIVERAGMTIPEIFRVHGERYFRDMEAEIVQEAAAEADGRVISSGGGAVLREENTAALKKTGILVFLDRKVEDLVPSDGRPLGDSREKLEALYEKRYRVYLAAADCCVPVKGTPEKVLREVLDLVERTERSAG